MGWKNTAQLRSERSTCLAQNSLAEGNLHHLGSAGFFFLQEAFLLPMFFDLENKDM